MSGLAFDHDALPETCHEDDHVPGCAGRAGGDHEYTVRDHQMYPGGPVCPCPGSGSVYHYWFNEGRTRGMHEAALIRITVTQDTIASIVTGPVSMLRCSECGDLLDFGECATHGPLDREGSDG